ncbi:MAG TPA: hypothetical protein VK604_23960 [Bryobacteraceae bacterium]|nr:hypothetical protein [Bryobacteraceae bacterium]
MEEQQRLRIFQAQTCNVRELEQAWRHVNRQINSFILQKNQKAVEINTKLLALLYCALSEAVFSKLIHTPHGLRIDEIKQIKDAIAADGVRFGWLKCARLAIRRVEGAKHNHQPNVVQKLSSLIEQSIFDPSLIRNKLAHGQWCVALNRENTAVNQDITRELADHTVVELYRRKHSLQCLAAIMEDMMESPNKAHRRDYWEHLVGLENEQKRISTWTFEGKVKQLFTKRQHSRHDV